MLVRRMFAQPTVICPCISVSPHFSSSTNCFKKRRITPVCSGNPPIFSGIVIQKITVIKVCTNIYYNYVHVEDGVALFMTLTVSVISGANTEKSIKPLKTFIN